MKSKPTPSFSFIKFMFFLLLLVPSTQYVFGQQITPKALKFNQICAGGPHPTKPGEIFNEYQAFFSITGFASDEKFYVELSDPTGSFATPTATTVLTALPGTPLDTATDKTLTFAVPTNLVGSNLYKLRVVSASGFQSGPFTIFNTSSTKTFPAYYKAYTDAFAINSNQSAVSFCAGGSATLTVFNPTPEIPDSSPANYPQLKYSWYKDDVIIPGETTTSLSVNTAGVYYAKIDYGGCSDDNYSSQSVTVSVSTGASFPIVSSLGNPLCGSLGNTVLSVTPGKTYIWKKDDVVINGATAQTYLTNVPGIYTCDVDFGGCNAKGTIDLKVLDITSTINVEAKNFIIEGEALNVTTTTTAVSPTYQWLFNDLVIPGADKSTLNVSAQGKYKVIITETTSCIITDEFPFEVSFKVNLNVAKIPNIVTPNGDGVNDTWIIPDEYISGTNTHILILNTLGEIVFETNNYDNYAGWPQTAIEFTNFNPVYYYIITPNGGSAKKGSITLLK
ncbi:gliding motility-associated C-terminal domain-containing protein [Flavobacterium taihuense]|uniref:Gliding motility-associated C-terminal domain-containing protein n=1 Tax=Flavobacterium taihuense TaxID=2857508 RepID=A0ABS6XQA5_9FLAO|nr:gliding motility-associated C-terminal domain-containing protein [Flavobacterium taihuense]MBW4358860.1 gliding motility-associated C-terminal domain-containing protein [Flavobacterium taihuense]